jgi:hypothetical protein
MAQAGEGAGVLRVASYRCPAAYITYWSSRPDRTLGFLSVRGRQLRDSSPPRRVTSHPQDLLGAYSSREISQLAEEQLWVQAEVYGVAEDLDAGLADHVAGGFGVAAGVDQVAGRQAEGGAVGEQLVEVGVRVAGGFLCPCTWRR